MSPVRRIVSLVSFGLLLAVASGCTGPRVSQAEIDAARALAARTTPETRLVTVTPRPAGKPPIVVQASSGRAPTATPAAAAETLLAPTSLRVPTVNRVVLTVDSTDGEGLWVRREPAGEPVRIWPDGSPMLVVGEDAVAEERLWRQVMTLDGETGWAAADFLVPADEQALAAAVAAFNQPPQAALAPPPLDPGLQARVANAVATATPAPAATAAPTATRRPASVAGQGATATATPRSTTNTTTAVAQPANQQAVQPTETPPPLPTPIRAPSGATSFDVDDATLELIGKNQGLPLKIGSRPRDGMELVAVQVRITNSGDAPMAVYRGGFRLALADRTRVEPLAGGESPIPYSATLEPGDTLEGWLTFEAPKDARIDALIWSPDHGPAYALGL